MVSLIAGRAADSSAAVAWGPAARGEIRGMKSLRLSSEGKVRVW